MDISQASVAMAALGHEPRLEVFRLLIKTGPAGMAAGDIARTMGARQNTLSSNLRILSSAGLISARRDGRSVIYSAKYDGIYDLLNFLVEDCCGAAPEGCG